MKKFIMLLVMLLVSFNVFAEPAEMKCPDVYSGTILASGSDTTPVLQTIRKSGFEGLFSVQIIKSGTGVLSLGYQISNDGTNWSPAVSIIATVVSGTVYQYPASGVGMVSGYHRLVLTETGAANPVVISGVWQCRQ